MALRKNEAVRRPALFCGAAADHEEGCMSVRELLNAGGNDMILELGVPVRLMRKGAVYASCYAVVSPASVGYTVEIGGAEKQVTAHCMFRVHDLPQIPQAGDRITVPGSVGREPIIYYVTTVTHGATDPMIHMDLAS